MRPRIHGPVVDDQTRCIHYQTVLDVVAIQAACCRRFYPCHLCHDQTESHELLPWPAGSGAQSAVLCGVCSTVLTVDQYIHATACPSCQADFNPGCALHYPVYFTSH